MRMYNPCEDCVTVRCSPELQYYGNCTAKQTFNGLELQVCPWCGEEHRCDETNLCVECFEKMFN